MTENAYESTSAKTMLMSSFVGDVAVFPLLTGVAMRLAAALLKPVVKALI